MATNRDSIPASAVEPPTYELLGVRIHALRAAELQQVIAEAIRADRHVIFAHHNLHSIYLHHSDEQMRRFYELSSHIYVDGMPLAWIGHLLGYPFRNEHRCTAIDWMPAVFRQAADEGWRVFYLGSAPGVAERGAHLLRERWHHLQIATAHGYFDLSPDSPEAEAVVARIRAYRPHILCVGMGMPRQEHWIATFASSSGANAVISVGALMDLLAGELRTPPRWIGRIGLEWLFRLLTTPRRVWHRYLIEPWGLLPHLLRDLVSRRDKLVRR